MHYVWVVGCVLPTMERPLLLRRGRKQCDFSVVCLTGGGSRVRGRFMHVKVVSTVRTSTSSMSMCTRGVHVHVVHTHQQPGVLGVL